MFPKNLGVLFWGSAGGEQYRGGVRGKAVVESDVEGRSGGGRKGVSGEPVG